MKRIYIYGASGHGLVVADMARSCGYETVLFLDDGENEYPTFEDVKNTNEIPIALGVGDNNIREKLFNRVKQYGFTIVSLIHPSSVISSTVRLGRGVVIMPNVVVNASAIVGVGVILNSGSVIEHECKIEDFVHISPNAALAGGVKVGKYTHIGIGTNVIQGVSIGDNVIIGAGSTVVKNINNFKKAYGTPCKEVKGNQK